MAWVPAAVKPTLDDWDRHWEDYAETAAKNPAQAYRRALVLRMLAADNRQRPMRILDVGSGTGDLAADIHTAFPSAEVLGIDISQAAVERAARKVPNATFLQRNLLHETVVPPRQRSWATHAVCSEVLEHVEEPRTLLANVRTYLAPDCRMIVTVPGGPMSAYDRHIGHRRHFTPHSLGVLLTETGFDVERAGRAGFPFFNLYRVAVLLRGRRLVDDGAHRASSLSARTATKVFDLLFKLNVADSPWGWQVFAAARFGGPTS